MNNTITILNTISWIFGIAVFATGVLNLFLVHPVPGAAYIFVSLIYFPPVNLLLRERTGFAVPLILKILLGIAIFMFTLGVSDLGDMIDKL